MEEEVKQLRSRIKEEFSEEDLDFLHGLVYSGYFDSNNDKADAILFRFKDRGFVELAPATNRFALLRGEYVYKFALDRYGIKVPIKTQGWFNQKLAFVKWIDGKITYSYYRTKRPNGSQTAIKYLRRLEEVVNAV